MGKRWIEVKGVRELAEGAAAGGGLRVAMGGGRKTRHSLPMLGYNHTTGNRCHFSHHVASREMRADFLDPLCLAFLSWNA